MDKPVVKRIQEAQRILLEKMLPKSLEYLKLIVRLSEKYGMTDSQKYIQWQDEINKISVR